MLRTTTVLAALTFPALALAAPQGWQPLLEPAELAAILEAEPDVRVIHVTGDFAQGHIPGALSSPYANWRGAPENPGALRDVSEFESEVRQLGIDADTPVVVIHSGANQTDMGAAARVYWTLKSLGVEDLALLNGGFAAWTEAGLPVGTEPVDATPSAFQAEWDDSLRVSTAEVKELVDSGDARLIDARPRGFFEGLTWSIARPGTIRGAEHLTYEDWFRGNSMVSAQEARDLAEAAGQTDSPLTVSFCNTGHWAAINWFALSELAGVENTRLYAESMAEWTQQGGALDNQPSRIAYYWESTKRWVSDLF